jgi:hypothetical protein
VLVRLRTAGWDVESWDSARVAGASLDIDFEAEYAGPFVILRLELLSQLGYLLLQIAEPSGGPLLRLRLFPADDIEPAIERIISMQDTVDEDNHPTLVKSLIPLCKLVQIETEDGIYRLSQQSEPRTRTAASSPDGCSDKTG